MVCGEKLRWPNFQSILHLPRLNAAALTLSFSCILNKHGLLSGDLHLDSKFHYKNSRHVPKGALVPLPALCLELHATIPEYSTDPRPPVFLSNPSRLPLTDYFLAQLLPRQPSAPSPSAVPWCLLHSVAITHFGAHGCPHSSPLQTSRPPALGSAGAVTHIFSAWTLSQQPSTLD